MGTLPEYNPEIELLTIVFQNPEHWPLAFAQIKPHMFLSERSRSIWDLYLKFFDKAYKLHDTALESALIDLAAQSDNVPGPKGEPSVAVMAGEILGNPGTLNPQFFIDKIKEAYILKERSRLSREISVKASRQEDFETERLELSSLDNEEKDYCDKQQLIDKIIDSFDIDESVKMIPTGFKGLDQIISGWRQKNMIVIAARPGMGKTAFAVNIILKSMAQGYSPIFFSTEMSLEEVQNRLLGVSSGVGVSKIDLGKKSLKEREKDDIFAAIKKLKNFNSNSYFVSKSVDMKEIFDTCKHVKFQNGKVDIVIVDYLQRIRPTISENRFTTREREVAEISTRCKDLSMKFDCPVILIAQPSREIDRRGDSKPKNSDLRDSGQIEQDADLVMWLHQDEDLKKRDIVEIIVTKNRHGPQESCSFEFKKETLTFIDIPNPSHMWVQ